MEIMHRQQRRLFWSMVGSWTDLDFLADAKRLQMELDPLKGDEIEQLLKTAYSAPAPIVDRAASLVP